MTVSSSTITANAASVSGGGVYAGLSTIELSHATLAANTAPNGSNLDLDSDAGFTSFASIVATPLGGGASCQLAIGTLVATEGGNISSDDSCGFGIAEADLVDTDPELGPLADNGGPTPTMAPPAGSPAIDRVACDPAVAADQRGVARPQGIRCDSGAVEVEAAAMDEPDEPTGGDPGASSDPITPSGAATPVRVSPRFTG
jgi:hypothetical protein